MIAETPFWKNEADRFFQYQENVNINFTIKEEWRYWTEIENLSAIYENFKIFLRFTVFVHHSKEVKNGQSFRKIYFFYFQPILTATENDS